MRILIDATSLLVRSAGVKNYTYHWIQAMRRQAGGDEIRAFPYLGDLGPLRHEGSTLAAFETYARLALLHLANARFSPLIEWITAGVDVVHASNQMRNPPAKARLTATVYDFTCWLMPEFHTAANVRAEQNFAKHILRRADGLIAISENTRKDAVRLLGLDPERITVIHPGIPDAFFKAKPAGASKPYVLFLATIEPRKNLEGLLDAWELLRDELRAEFELVIAGPTGWNSERVLARLNSGMPGVRYAGYIPEKDLPGLVAGASVFAYPSLYEGFGFPVAQAMACGVAVLTSCSSSLPEVAGEGALYADPRSPAELAAQLERLLGSAELRARLGAAGRQRASRYGWEECARRSLEFFRSLA